MDVSYLQIVTTTPQHAQATQIAEALIEKSLAACVQIEGPIDSIYRWKEAVEREQEWRLSIKTTSKCYEAARELVFQMHAYEQPQWIAFRIESLDIGYQKWIDEQTRS